MNQLLAFYSVSPSALIQLQVVEPLVLTTDRLVANIGVVLALVGVIAGVLALRRSADHASQGRGKRGAIVAFTAGFIAATIGGILLLTADSGPGSGNGVVGAALAIVLGVVAIVVGAAAIARSSRTA